MAHAGGDNRVRLGRALNEKCAFVHPGNARISGLSHIQWTGAPTSGRGKDDGGRA
jgi:proline racemase